MCIGERTRRKKGAVEQAEISRDMRKLARDQHQIFFHPAGPCSHLRITLLYEGVQSSSRVRIKEGTPDKRTTVLLHVARTIPSSLSVGKGIDARVGRSRCIDEARLDGRVSRNLPYQL